MQLPWRRARRRTVGTTLSFGSSASTSSLTTVAKTTAAVASGAHAYLDRTALPPRGWGGGEDFDRSGLSGRPRVYGILQGVAAAPSGGDTDTRADDTHHTSQIYVDTCSDELLLTSRWCVSGCPVLSTLGYEHRKKAVCTAAKRELMTRIAKHDF